MKALWIFIFLFAVGTTVLSHEEKSLKRQKRHRDDDNDAIDLRKTKRNIYQALLKKKTKDKRSVDDNGAVDIDGRSTIQKNNKRKYRKDQVQEIRTRIEVVHEWREGMVNHTSPEYELLAGNIIDAIANEFVADRNYISAAVSKLTKTKSLRKIIADVVFRFFKAEDDPVSHIQGVIAKGWISGQEVDPNYFKLLQVTNGNHEKTQWKYPEGVELRVIPVVSTKKKTNQNLTRNPIESTKGREKPLAYKEIQVSLKLKQRYVMFLDDTNSPEFAELGGNLQQAILKIFSNDRLFIDARVVSFRESEEGRVIATIAIQFNPAEKYAIEKTQAMISSGDLAGMPVDEEFFIVDAMKEFGKSIAPLSTEHIPQSKPLAKKTKPKPLKYKEVRLSIKFNEPWNISFENETSAPFSYFSGVIEQAIDRAFSGDIFYIDATVDDFLESSDARTISNIAVRFHLEESDPERRLKLLIEKGDISGVPVDSTFFYVFTLSETTHPGPNGQTQETIIDPSSILAGTKSNNVQQSIIEGQKQPAAYQPKPTDQIQRLKPSIIGIENTTEPNSFKVPTTMPPITHGISTTFNPFLPIKENKETPGSSSPTPEMYLDSSQGKVQNSVENNIYKYPYTQNSEQSWYPTNTEETLQNLTPTFNPYLSNESIKANATNTVEEIATYNPYLPETTKAPLTNTTPSAVVEAVSEDIEGSMTLEQTWHPYLSDKSSQVYKVLEQNIVTSIKNVYSEENEDVIPEILGFSETDIPSESVSITNEKKVAVRFKISFLQNHKPSAKPLEDAVASKSVAGILIYQNSLIIAASSSHKSQNGLVTTTKELTLCQKQQRYAESSTDGPIGGFVPQCKDDGNYKSAQCHALTGFCWCVNEVGVRISGTEQRYKQPSCNQIKIIGNMFLPQDSPDDFPTGSCLTVYIQENTSCNGSFIDCKMPVVVNKTYTHLSTNNIELTTQDLKPSVFYTFNAIFNVGWCNKGLSKDSVQDGDYMTHAVNEFVLQEGKKIYEFDINLESVKQYNGIVISGNIILPLNSSTRLPLDSCLTIFIQELIACNPSNINCHIPVLANQTFRQIKSINNSIPYKLTTTKLKAALHYVINAVVNMGWCRVNSLKSSEQIRDGDYHTVDLHEFIIGPGDKNINKDITVEYLKPEETGIHLHGNIILPKEVQLTTLPEGSCLSIQTKLLQLCTGANCPTASLNAMKIIEDLEIENNQIPYSILLPELEPGTYVISAVLHVGRCIRNGQSMINGDYFNDEMYDYTISRETTDVEKNIKVIQLNENENDGVVVYGTVALPENEQLPPGSCLYVSSRKLIQCRNNNCKIPPVSTKRFENIINNNGVRYTLNLPAATAGQYIISAVVNLGWCKSEDGAEWIHQGDYYNDKIHDFEIKNATNAVERNITVQRFHIGEEKTGVTVHGRVILPLNSNDEKFPITSCITIKAQEYRPCNGGLIHCVSPLSAKETYHNPQVENNVIPYALILPNIAHGHYILSAVLNIGWCKETNSNNNDDWIHVGDYHNEIVHDFVINQQTEEVEVDINLEKYIETYTGSPQRMDGTEHITSIDQLLTTAQPSTKPSWVADHTENDSFVKTSGKPPVLETTTGTTTSKEVSNETVTRPDVPVTPFLGHNNGQPSNVVKIDGQPWEAAYHPQINIVTTMAAPLKNKEASYVSDRIQTTTKPYHPASQSAINSLITPAAIPNASESSPFDLQTTTTEVPANLEAQSQGGNSVMNLTNNATEVDIMKEQAQVSSNVNETELSKEIITLPEGLPKSCEDLRNVGIGNQNGQYIIEARLGCHISIICQGMEDEHPKEFLGGPSEDEWKYWHYAVLIRISERDKENLPSGACLEHSDAGRDLLKRILLAGAQQGNPISQWKTNISKLLRTRRDTFAGESIITKAITIYKGSKASRQNVVLNSEWGVL